MATGITVSPAREAGELLIQAARETGLFITVEEHSVIGGLGDAVLGAIGENPVPVVKIGVQDTFGYSGPGAALLEAFGLCADAIAKTAAAAYQKRMR